jgi:spermidine synthase
MDAKGNLHARLTLGAAFLLMGFTFTITQVLLVRELLISFAGNELSIGLVLGSWFLLEALGSWLLGRLAARVGDGRVAYARLQIILALTLALVLCAALSIRRLIGAVPGQGLGLLTISLTSFLLLIPVALVDGAMFAVGCKAAYTFGQGESDAVRRVYVGEAVGGVIGGFVFTYGFIPHLQSVQVALLLGALNLASALSLLLLPSPSPSTGSRAGLQGRAGILASVVLLAIVLGLLFSPGANQLHHYLVASQWPGFELAFYGNSPYGNVAAIRREEQVTFLANGVPILSAPVPDVAQVEEMVHLPMLFVPQPRRVLVLSGGLGGVIRELLKYPLERVDYAELDPLLIQAVASLPSPLTEGELTDPRVHIERLDGRLLVNRLAVSSSSAEGGAQAAAYDLILINLPYPTTLQLNRFYTLEFWRLVHGLLTEEGIVAFQVPGSLSYFSPGLRDLHNALHLTLAQVFAHLRPIPDDMTLWLASPSTPLEAIQPETLVARWQARGISSSLITPFHIRLKLDKQHLAWFWDALQAGRPVVSNQDLRPSGLLYGLAYWNEQFSPALAPYLSLLGRVSLPILMVPVLLLALGGSVIVRLSPKRRAGPIISAIATTGFAGMTADLLVIFAFQVFYGYVYQFVGLLVTAFMAGLSLGGWAMGREEDISGDYEWLRDRRKMLRLEAGLLIFWLVLPVALTLLHGIAERGRGSTAVGPALMALNGLAGFLGGAQFPLANRMYRRIHPQVVGTAGLLYAADLVGACAAAVLVSVVLLPALGIVQTCLLVAALKAGSWLTWT